MLPPFAEARYAVAMKSFLTHLECTDCKQTFSASELHTTCPACGKVLFARYDLDGARRAMTREGVAARAPSMWRWFEIMPVLDEANVVSLGDGTPMPWSSLHRCLE